MLCLLLRTNKILRTTSLLVCISDEVHCLETSSPPDKSYFATDVFVIFLVLSLLVAMVVILVLAVNKYSGKMRKQYSSSSQLSSDLFCHSERDFTPSCPPADGRLYKQCEYRMSVYVN